MDFRDLAKDESGVPGLMYGTVAKAAADITDLVPVILPDYDEHLQWGPCRWQSRDAVSLPAKGNACLVAFDNRREPWIVAWWPF